jgi:hypothetical protein
LGDVRIAEVRVRESPEYLSVFFDRGAAAVEGREVLHEVRELAIDEDELA